MSVLQMSSTSTCSSDLLEVGLDQL